MGQDQAVDNGIDSDLDCGDECDSDDAVPEGLKPILAVLNNTRQSERRANYEIFVEYYDGDVTSTVLKMRESGLVINEGRAKSFLRNAEVQNLIRAKHRAASGVQRNAYSPDELREFWTKVLADENATMKDRLEASEKLGRSMAMFIDKRENRNIEEVSLVTLVREVDKEEKAEEKRMLS